ncbi:MAG TPA: SbcC/MukB-like Walker B domain-containing protein [Anaerolineae bacterium]|nr:SbcC/MukB-like Walker B domain-containing protein [Anaerolineae bacterium]
MKLLTRIRLINWHLFENATISCQGTTYFIGVNGVGKSTVLDAVQFALVGGQRDVKFNVAALSSGKRTLAGYVRGELGTEGQRFLRGDATGVVALEFRNSDESAFVHGAVIDAYADGRELDVVYFIVHNAGLNDDWFFKAPGQVFDSRAFKRRLEHFALPRGARAQVFSKLEDYRFHLLNRLGQLKESFLAKVVKGLAFSPLTDIRAFVHNYLLDENLVDVKTLQAQLETLRHFESLAADVRERIAALDRIEELDQERIAHHRRRITNGYIQRRAQGDAHLAELKNRRLELDEIRLALNRAALQRDELTEQLKRAQAALLDAQIALNTDVTAAREKDLREKIAALDAELRALREREARVKESLAREAADAQKLREMLLADDQPVPSVLDAFVAQPPREAPNLQSPTSNLQPLISSLDSLGQEYSRQDALLHEQTRLLREEAESIERELRSLRTGDREASYEAEAPQAARLRRLLRDGLGLSADEVIYLCTALRIPDDSWQDAVEGVLGHNRFTLLVPPAHYDAAMRLYRERRHTDDLHGVGLLDAERITKYAPRNIPSTSLASEIHTDHPAARAFIDLVLGGYVKCDTLEAMRDHRTAVTRECFVRRNFTTSHLNPRIYRRWFIGERAIPRRIEQLEARLGEIAGELATLNDRTLALRERLALTRDKVRRFVELEHALPDLERIPALVAQLKTVKAELAALDTRTAESLRAEVERRTAEVEKGQAEVAELDRQIGGWENQAKTLGGAIIPALEKAIDEALHSAQQFLSTELAEDMQEDVAKEYDRRRERQPLETVLQNATRYEGDYQGAESKSRDKLREAKQAYSLRYDFGYDEDEDAARYLREREKFTQSELPQYEARIAEQRALAEQELVENFIHRLREQIEEARQQLDYLNDTLKDLRFGGERFEFITRPEPSLRQVYDMVMDSQSILGDSLFESDFRQKHQQGWDLLFERLTRGMADEASIELRELQDYRNYLQYDVRIHYPGGDRALLSQINAKKSGGETTTPFYVAMAASFAQAYRLTQPRASDTIRLALFDEAFSKMDTARTASALQFMREAGLQVLLATPPDKSGALLPHVDSVRTVVRKNNHSFVIEIDKADMLAEIEGES